MKPKDAKLAATLLKAIAELPKTRRALSDKRGRYEGIWLEIQAAQMMDGQSQGSDHWFDLPPQIGHAILDAAEKIIRDELKRLGVKA